MKFTHWTLALVCIFLIVIHMLPFELSMKIAGCLYFGMGILFLMLFATSLFGMLAGALWEHTRKGKL